jgi:hypothetical protein
MIDFPKSAVLTTMANISVFFDVSMSDDERRDRLYRGDIFVFSPTAASRKLIDLGGAML